MLTPGSSVVTLESLEAQRGSPLTFGDVLRGIRTCDHEVTQVEFARFLRMAPSQVCDIEQGRRILSVQAVSALAKKLGQSRREFIFYSIRDQARAQMRKAGIKGTFYFDVEC